MSIIWAFGLVLIIEGLGPLLFPNKWAAYIKKIANEDTATLQKIGGGLMLTGALILFLFK